MRLEKKKKEDIDTSAGKWEFFFFFFLYCMQTFLWLRRYQPSDHVDGCLCLLQCILGVDKYVLIPKL